MSFERLDSDLVYRGKVFNVRKDRILLPDGKTAQIDVVEHAGAVVIIPIDSDGQVWFIRQYRHPVERELMELPAGVIDPGENPQESAIRELREEIGMTANQLTLLGDFFLAPGYSSEIMHVYLAEDLAPSPLQPDESEFIDPVKVPNDQVLELIKSGEVQDAKSLAAILLWRYKT